MKAQTYTRAELSAKIAACCAVQGERGTRILAMLALWQWQGAPEVGTVREYCEACSAWFLAEVKRARDVRPITPESHAWYQRVAAARDCLRLDMGKSNLLARVLYGGEEIRTRPCPYATPTHKCQHSGCAACGGTGWLPNSNACDGGIEWALGTPFSEYLDCYSAPGCAPLDAACEIPDLEVMHPLPERAVDWAKSPMYFGRMCE